VHQVLEPRSDLIATRATPLLLLGAADWTPRWAEWEEAQARPVARQGVQARRARRVACCCHAAGLLSLRLQLAPLCLQRLSRGSRRCILNAPRLAALTACGPCVGLTGRSECPRRVAAARALSHALSRRGSAGSLNRGPLRRRRRRALISGSGVALSCPYERSKVSEGTLIALTICQTACSIPLPAHQPTIS